MSLLGRYEIRFQAKNQSYAQRESEEGDSDDAMDSLARRDRPDDADCKHCHLHTAGRMEEGHFQYDRRDGYKG